MEDTTVLVWVMVEIWRVDITASEVGIVCEGIVAFSEDITAIWKVGATASASAKGTGKGGAGGFS
jgi:hypothetical protein